MAKSGKRVCAVFWLIVFLIANFSLNVAFSALTDLDKKLLQNKPYNEEKLVKRFEKAYYYAMIGSIISAIFHVFGALAFLNSICGLVVGSIGTVALFLIAWGTVRIPSQASAAMRACNAPESWAANRALRTVIGMLGSNSPEAVRLTDGCMSLRKHWIMGLCVLITNDIMLIMVLWISLLAAPSINIVTFVIDRTMLGRRKRNRTHELTTNPKSEDEKGENTTSNDVQDEVSQELTDLDMRRYIKIYPHYADMVRFCETEGGFSIKAGDIEKLRLLACEAGTKTQCWGCGNQICQSCTKTIETAKPNSTRHLNSCLPYCSWCHFLFLFSRRLQDIEMTGNACDRTFHEEIQEKPSDRPTMTPITETTSVFKRAVCRSCANLESVEVIGIYEQRELKQTGLMARNLQCHSCVKQLHQPNWLGVLPSCWWRCDSCDGTCWWDKHTGVR